ncbi:MAG: DUF4388 domain-containing protein [Myxococcota bacterium]|nr:DUF4388 domain-containing protein [Myxococcota bacterium]
MTHDEEDVELSLDSHELDELIPGRIDTSDLLPQAVGDFVVDTKQDLLPVEIDPEGRLRSIRSDDSDFRRIIDKGVRRSVLLPTAPGWAVFKARTTPEEPPNAREHAESSCEVVMTGQMGSSGVSVMEIVGFLADTKETGILCGSVDGIERSIFLKDGDLVGTQSNAPEERLGSLLIKTGKITEDQLSSALLYCENGRRIGQACVELEFLTRQVVWEMVKRQHVENFENLLSMERGLWYFRRVRKSILNSSSFFLPTQYLLMDTIRKFDEMRLYRETVPSFDAGVIVHPDIETTDFPKTWGTKTLEMAKQMVGFFAGDSRESGAFERSATIRELLFDLGCSDFDMTRLLYLMAEADLIEFHELMERESSVSGVGPEGPILLMSAPGLSAVLRVYSKALDEIFIEYSKIQETKNLAEILRAYLIDPEVELPASIRMLQINDEGRLEQDELLELLQSYPMGQTQLCSAMDMILFFTLFEATESLNAVRSEELVRRIHGIRSLLPKEQKI